MKHPPSRAGKVLPGLVLELNGQGKLSVRTDLARFDILVARYYPAVYNFAFQLTDDPRKAVWLTHAAFLSIRKQLWRPRDEIEVVKILLKAVFRGRGSKPSNFGPRHRPVTTKPVGRDFY